MKALMNGSLIIGSKQASNVNLKKIFDEEN
jgi:hypothetical protein